MAHEYVHVVFPEFVVICQSLGVVCTEAGVLILGEFTVNTDFRAVEGIVIVVIKRAAPVYGGCGVELEPGSDVGVGRECAVQLVADGIVLVVPVASQRVTRLEERSGYRIVLPWYTIVILLVSVGVCSDDRISVRVENPDINRIDRAI